MGGRRRKRPRKNPLRTFFRWVLFALFCAAALFFAIVVTGGTVYIADGSMNPTLQEGDKVILDSLCYYVRDPRRGDLVRFPSDSGNSMALIRRIVGLPGETVQIIDGKVFINGAVLDETAYAAGTVRYFGTASVPLTLSEDEYFVMADNRGSNFDSRDPTVGNVSKADISGRLWLRISPIGRMGFPGCVW